jgi:protein-S-isoprenylcysteine O-methyltransferase Ste14
MNHPAGDCCGQPAVLADGIFRTRFNWRIHVEESALCRGLGDIYRDYMRCTRRLIPFIY